MSGSRPRDHRAEEGSEVPDLDVVAPRRASRSMQAPKLDPVPDLAGVHSPDLALEPVISASPDLDLIVAVPAPAHVMDLELPVAPAPTSKPSLEPQGRSALDDLDDEDAGAPLALEIDTSGGSLPPAVAASIPSPPLSGRVSVPSPPVSGRVSAAPPPTSGRPPDPASLPPSSLAPPLEVDPFDARVLVDYEPPPESIFLTPVYAYKVIRRRVEVVKELAEARADAERAQQGALEALYNFGERLRPMLEAQGGRGLEQVQQIEQLLRSRDAALAAEMDQHKARLADIDARVAEVEREAASARAAVQTAQAEVDAVQGARARIDAKIKRIEIELRNAQAVQGGGTPGVELDLQNISQSAAAFDRARSEHAQELARAAAILQQKEEALAEVARQASALAQRASAMQNERNAENARFQRQLATRAQGQGEARDHYKNALADVARTMLAGALPPELEPYRKDAIAAEERVHKTTLELRKYEVGLDSYDKGKVAIGLAISIIAATILVILILFPYIYRAIVVG